LQQSLGLNVAIVEWLIAAERHSRTPKEPLRRHQRSDLSARASGADDEMAATVATFRRIALSQREATEGSHMGHPDFRVRNKVFASLGVPDKGWGTVKLTPEQQEVLLDAEPAAFRPAAGAWGRRGWTQVNLAAADAATLTSALEMAWRNTAPKALVARHPG
jgi:hypothetical protein